MRRPFLSSKIKLLNLGLGRLRVSSIQFNFVSEQHDSFLDFFIRFMLGPIYLMAAHNLTTLMSSSASSSHSRILIFGEACQKVTCNINVHNRSPIGQHTPDIWVQPDRGTDQMEPIYPI